MKLLPKAGLCILVLFAIGSVAYGQEIQTGTIDVNGATPGVSALQKGSGERSVTIDVVYQKPYDVKPDVIVSLSELDIPKDSPLRLSAKAISISRDGFTIVVKTWEDSRLNSCSVNWIAISQKKP